MTASSDQLLKIRQELNQRIATRLYRPNWTYTWPNGATTTSKKDNWSWDSNPWPLITKSASYHCANLTWRIFSAILPPIVQRRRLLITPKESTLKSEKETVSEKQSFRDISVGSIGSPKDVASEARVSSNASSRNRAATKRARTRTRTTTRRPRLTTTKRPKSKLLGTCNLLIENWHFFVVLNSFLLSASSAKA